MQLLDDGGLSDKPEGIDLGDVFTSKQMAEYLMEAYPGYRWGVRCQWKQGVAHVFNLDVSGNLGFTIHLVGRHAIGGFSASAFKEEVVKAGGEILERFRLSRAEFKPDEYENATTDFQGLLVGDKAR